MFFLDPQSVTQKFLDQIDQIKKRAKRIFSMNEPTMKVFTIPRCVSLPVISPVKIFDISRKIPGFIPDRVKRVPGGACNFLEHVQSPSSYLEINEYGIVYYVKRLPREGTGVIQKYRFSEEIANLLCCAKSLYGDDACEALENIAVVAELVNVFGEKLSDIGERVCYTSEFSVSTSKDYLSSNFNEAAHLQTICTDLTMQVLWAFDVATNNQEVRDGFEKVIEEQIAHMT